jgi:hypothetical protein
MGDFVFIAAFVLLVVLGPWVLVLRTNSRRKRERAEDQERWQELTSRTNALEETVRSLQSQRPAPAAKEATPKASEIPIAAANQPPSPAPGIVPPPTTPPVVDPSSPGCKSGCVSKRV